MKIKRNPISFTASDNGTKFIVHFLPLGKTCPGFTHRVMIQPPPGATWLLGVREAGVGYFVTQPANSSSWHQAGWLATGYAVNCKHAKFFLEKFHTDQRELKRQYDERDRVLTITAAIVAGQPNHTLQLTD